MLLSHVDLSDHIWKRRLVLDVRTPPIRRPLDPTVHRSWLPDLRQRVGKELVEVHGLTSLAQKTAKLSDPAIIDLARLLEAMRLGVDVQEVNFRPTFPNPYPGQYPPPEFVDEHLR